MREWGLALAVLGILGAAQGEEAGGVDEATRRKVASYLKDLSYEEFTARDDAEAALKELGGTILPLLEEALGVAKDADTRRRLERLVAEGLRAREADPGKLDARARQAAGAAHFELAARLYEAAGAGYRRQAEAAQEEAAKKALQSKAEKATERQRRAAEAAEKGKADGVDW
ncbi:MAG: hypothetical protein M5U26_16725 [Planctomycetota bacterium]|nr:hypothetical protein [Planctomycetota bacterium]